MKNVEKHLTEAWVLQFQRVSESFGELGKNSEAQVLSYFN
jgi:hypothetical protein